MIRYTYVALPITALAIVMFECASEVPGNGRPDTGDDTSKDNVEAGVPHLVVIHALDQALAAIGSTDIRVCLGTAVTDFALPEDPSIAEPLANYPGILQGGGIDLGDHDLLDTVYVFSARQLGVAKNFLGGSPVSCSELTGVGASAQPHLTVVVPPTSGNNRVLVLADDVGDGGNSALAYTSILDDAIHGPIEGGVAIYGQFGAYGPWAVHPVQVDAIDQDATTPLTQLTDTQVQPPAAITITPTSFDSTSLRFTAGAAQVAQTLRAIQVASNPTTTPESFYGVRANFLFVALGTPPGDAGTDAGARALHITAVPFVP